jgi:hypothetical protein
VAGVNPSGAQIEQLHVELVAKFDLYGLTQFLLFKLDQHLNQITSASGFDEIVLEVIQRSVRRGWFCQLLSMLAQHHTHADVRAAAAQLHGQCCVELRWYGQHDPNDTLFIGKLPFLNRNVLRSHLNEIANGDASVVAVSGPPLSGKSYTWNLLRKLCDARGLIGVNIDLGEYRQPVICDPEDLMKDIARHLDIGSGVEVEKEVEKEAEPARQAIALTGWLAGKLGSRTERWLVMLDGLDRASLSQGARDLVDKLIEKTAKQALRGFNLVVVGYDREIADPRLLLLREPLNPIGESEIGEFFRGLANQLRRPIDEEGVGVAVAKVLAGLEDPRVLHQRIFEVSSAVFGRGRA